MEYSGNKEIFKFYKTAFFCSRKCPSDIADEVFLAYASKNGNLDKLLKGIKNRKIKTFK